VTVPLSLLESTVQAAAFVAAGPSLVAAGALSASAASLSEGVIKTMFLAKLKGIAIAAGAMTVVVSGAVVLAQGGPKAKPGRIGPEAEAKVAAWSDRYASDDRAAALERKLDRVLEALERLPQAAETPRTRTVGAALPKLPDIHPSETPRSLPDRVQAVEEQIQGILERLKRLEAQSTPRDSRSEEFRKRRERGVLETVPK
jgi:hypothetical protein